MSNRITIEGIEYFICYDWRFVLTVLKKGGKKARNQVITSIGLDTDLATFNLMQETKKKGWLVKAIQSAAVKEISFAFNVEDTEQNLPKELYDQVPLPVYHICDACNVSWAPAPGLRCKKCTYSNKY